MLYDSIYMKFLEKAKLQRQKADQWLPSSGSESGERMQTEQERTGRCQDESVLKLDCGNGGTIF